MLRHSTLGVGPRHSVVDTGRECRVGVVVALVVVGSVWGVGGVGGVVVTAHRKVLVDARSDRLARDRLRSTGREQHEGEVADALADGTKELDTVHPGEVVAADDAVDRFAIDDAEPFGRVLGPRHLEPVGPILDARCRAVPDRQFVSDEEHPGRLGPRVRRERVRLLSIPFRRHSFVCLLPDIVTMFISHVRSHPSRRRVRDDGAGRRVPDRRRDDARDERDRELPGDRERDQEPGPCRPRSHSSRSVR